MTQFFGSSTLLRYWMPELAKPWLLFGTILNWQRNSKSPGSPLVQMRKVLDLSGSSALVLPVMAPSCTDHNFGLPLQPVRSLPLNSCWKPGSGSAAAAAQASATTPLIIETNDLDKLDIFIRSFAKISGLSPQ